MDELPANWVKKVDPSDFTLPSLPNYIRLPSDKRGMSHATFDVADLTPPQLRDIAQRWGTALIQHAQRRRHAREAAMEGERG